MSRSERPEDSESEVVSVSQHGQATIPKRFREKLELDAPGKVQFRETEDGEIVVEAIPSASDLRGFAARRREEPSEQPASKMLKEKRESDKEDLESDAHDR